MHFQVSHGDFVFKENMNYRALYKKHYNIQFGREYDVHHIDGNRENNSIDNLVLLPSKLHHQYHFSKSIVESVPLCTRIKGSIHQSNNYYYDCLSRFLSILRECNKWYDYKMFLDGVIPNVHNIEIKESNNGSRKS